MIEQLTPSELQRRAAAFPDVAQTSFASTLMDEHMTARWEHRRWNALRDAGQRGGANADMMQFLEGKVAASLARLQETEEKMKAARRHFQ